MKRNESLTSRNLQMRSRSSSSHLTMVAGTNIDMISLELTHHVNAIIAQHSVNSKSNTESSWWLSRYGISPGQMMSLWEDDLERSKCYHGSWTYCERTEGI